MTFTLPHDVVPWTRRQMAERVARDIKDGWWVNLGIGIPTMIADLIEIDREVLFHSENGVLGFGPAPEQGSESPWLINAGKQHVTLRAGGSYCHHADSFSIIRGGHLDLCVLGAFQVSAGGDLANWATSENDTAPAVGGAMDLAAGTERLWVVMEHLTRSGEARIVPECTYPLTAAACVRRIYTNLAVIDVDKDKGLVVIDAAARVTEGLLRACGDVPVCWSVD